MKGDLDAVIVRISEKSTRVTATSISSESGFSDRCDRRFIDFQPTTSPNWIMYCTD